MKTYAFLNDILATDGNANGISLALKGEIDYLQGRNEELREQIVQLKSENSKSQVALIKAQDEVEKFNNDVRLINRAANIKDLLQPFKLPPGMTPSSQDIISALNEYLVDTLQVNIDLCYRLTFFFFIFLFYLLLMRQLIHSRNLTNINA
jgi:hypothetical protein